jgi:hypothetical protein
VHVGRMLAHSESRVQPNDTRTRGAEPVRKPFRRPKICKAPHPLQPIVRPRRPVTRGIGVGQARLTYPQPTDSRANSSEEHESASTRREYLRKRPKTLEVSFEGPVDAI